MQLMYDSRWQPGYISSAGYCLMIERRSVFNLCRVFSVQCCEAVWQCGSVADYNGMWGGTTTPPDLMVTISLSSLYRHQTLPCRQQDWSHWSQAFPVNKLKYSKIQQMCRPRVEYSPYQHQHQDNHYCSPVFRCKISQFPWWKVCYHFNIKHNIPMFIQMHLFHFVSVPRQLWWEERDEWYLRKCLVILSPLSWKVPPGFSRNTYTYIVVVM